MDMVEVDIKLFVTCRLCLEDTGLYQIVPNVQQQIKYCYDIDVTPFDGFPQLLCKKCKSILDESFKTKKTFLDKQESLIKNGVKSKFVIPSQQDAVSSSEIALDARSTNDNTKEEVITSSNESNKITLETKKIQYSSAEWKCNYVKKFACRYCSRTFAKKSLLFIHMDTRHRSLEKYHKLVKHCFVNLPKIDRKPNLTGTNQFIVHDENKIVQSGLYYKRYYITYLSKNKNNIRNIQNEENDMHTQNSVNSDSSSDLIIKRKKRKRRLNSSSSTDTVLVESKKTIAAKKEKKSHKTRESNVNIMECIEINDSSDNDSENKQENEDKFEHIGPSTDDYKTIQNIIFMCENRYQKRIETSENKLKNKVKNYLPHDKQSTDIDMQLKHIILSVGRKTISKHNFACNSILRFMEHKNLDVVWMPRKSSTQMQDYIRLLTRVKIDNISDKNLDWKYISQIDYNNFNSDSAPSYVTFHDTFLQETRCLSQITESPNIPPSATQPVATKGEINDMEFKLIPSNDAEINLKNKLLNANPVANPKQLPKKNNMNENIRFLPTLSTNNLSDAESTSNEIVNEELGDDSYVCMPIITSTTSLAFTDNANEEIQPGDNANVISVSSGNNSEPEAPRIKVKPVSELMSESALSSLNQQNTPNAYGLQFEQIGLPNNNLNVAISNEIMPLQLQDVHVRQLILPSTSNQLTSPENVSDISHNNRDYIILHTVEFPNTKTKSPFNYLKRLLQTHSILLLDTDEYLSPKFACLIKFKVCFKQETRQQPVVLCLSLFCIKNVFCIKVRDGNQKDIDMSKISANWQWEILKVYQGDVVNKVLQNAQKISKATLSYTNYFVCLLKSIVLKDEV